MMTLLIGFLLAFLTSPNSPTPSVDCSLQDFFGTWEGKVEYEGDELAQGPYVFSLHEDGKSLVLKDETGKKYIYDFNADDCSAKTTDHVEGMDVTMIYILVDGKLQSQMLSKFKGPDGKMVEIDMKGSMSKVD